MLRRICLVILVVMSLTPTAWAKFKDEDQQYLDENFKAIKDQIKALTARVDSLNTRLADLSKQQADLGAFMVQQRRSIDDMDQMVKSLDLGGEDNFSKLEKAISQLRNETQAAFARLTGQPMPAAGGGETPSAPRPAVAAKAVQDYITHVEGNTLTVGLGSRQGITPGQRLVVFKANDPSTQVAVIEVTQVIDAGSSRCTVIQKNPGVELVFGDVVRVQ